MLHQALVKAVGGGDWVRSGYHLPPANSDKEFSPPDLTLSD